MISDLTWNTFRDHLVLEYEIPKYDGDLGHPNGFVSLSPEICQTKVSHLLDAFDSQRSKRWFEESTFMALMRIRGMECNSPSGHAEAFYLRKVTLSVSGRLCGSLPFSRVRVDFDLAHPYILTRHFQVSK